MVMVSMSTTANRYHEAVLKVGWLYCMSASWLITLLLQQVQSYSSVSELYMGILFLFSWFVIVESHIVHIKHIHAWSYQSHQAVFSVEKSLVGFLSGWYLGFGPVDHIKYYNWLIDIYCKLFSIIMSSCGKCWM